MKFTNGFWRIRDGVQITYAVEVRDVCVESKRFTAYAAAKKVARRGTRSTRRSSRSTASPPPRA